MICLFHHNLACTHTSTFCVEWFPINRLMKFTRTFPKNAPLLKLPKWPSVMFTGHQRGRWVGIIRMDSPLVTGRGQLMSKRTVKIHTDHAVIYEGAISD